MELQEARSRLQTLLNFFKGLEKLEEIVAVAESASQLQRERSEAVEAAGRKLQEANTAFALACEDHAKQRQHMQDELAELGKKRALTIARMEEELAAAEAQKIAAIAIARTKQAEAEHEAEAAIDYLVQRKAVLEKDIKQLEAALDKLKAKAAAL